MRCSSDRLLDVSIVKDPRAFAVLEEEWEDLHRNSPLATPFQSWAWLYSWWDFYGESYELRLVTMRDDTGLLVGLAPLMLERRGGVGRLLFLGAGTAGAGSPYDHDLLVRRGWETRVSAVGRRTLERMDGWHVVDLQQLRPGAVAWGIFEDWAGPRVRMWQDNFSVLDVRPWDELLLSLSRNLRSTIRRTLRRAEADGVRAELAGADDAEQAARRLVALSRELWRERWLEISPELWTQRYESFLPTAAHRMTVSGWGGISEFWRDGEAIISHFLVFGRDFVQVYTLGASRQALRQYQFSSLLIWDGMNAARGRNSRLFDLGRGREPYKLRWRSGVIPTHRMILGRSRIPWTLYAGYHLLRSTAKRYAYSEDVPQWVKGAVDRYRALRYTATRYVKEGRRT